MPPMRAGCFGAFRGADGAEPRQNSRWDHRCESAGMTAIATRAEGVLRRRDSGFAVDRDGWRGSV